MSGTAAVIGMGLMGCDISAIFLAGGWKVAAQEPATQSWPAKRERVRLALSQLGADPALEAGLSLHATLAEMPFAECGCVVEAAPERMELKREVFAELDRLVPVEVPIGSNASGYRITEIAKFCETKRRMCNLHFFLPAHLVPGVEVVKGEATEDWVVDRFFDIMASLGRMPIRVSRDEPGFLANRIQHALMREAFSCIDSGLATAEDVDRAVRYCFGFRYLAAGPILQKELAGLETQLAAATTIYPSLNTSPEPSPGLAKLVAENRLGPKTGRGYRDWPGGKAAEERARYERVLAAAQPLLRDEV
ncbi:3-hydroxyacyl-CoA dehydrogenase family protein [Roseococcus sp. YIM B11640]|uniref:3-hydroxyacyl-CoA dehydrogenase family protein n=1 Tax=Roseococcus sp. YIM B11640 TaxID=3133973 RepID=UPI003C7B7377